MKPILTATLFYLFLITCSAQIDLNQLNGTISAAESQTLEVIGENGNNQLMVDDSSSDYLRVTIKSGELYVASLCICNEKNEVIVLHASAALGSLLYKKGASSWSTSQKFDWQMREEGMDAATISKRRKYLDTNGWIANTMSMGRVGETEFIINRNAFNGELRLAIGLMAAENPNNIIGIPSTDAGDCADQKLVSGDPRSTYTFSPENWMSIN